jgi:hypothetical protein
MREAENASGKVGKFLPDYTTQQPRKQPSAIVPEWSGRWPSFEHNFTSKAQYLFCQKIAIKLLQSNETRKSSLKETGKILNRSYFTCRNVLVGHIPESHLHWATNMTGINQSCVRLKLFPSEISYQCVIISQDGKQIAGSRMGEAGKSTLRYLSKNN